MTGRFLIMEVDNNHAGDNGMKVCKMMDAVPDGYTLVAFDRICLPGWIRTTVVFEKIPNAWDDDENDNGGPAPMRHP